MAVGHDIRVPIEIRTVPADQPPAGDLLAAMEEELRSVYGDVALDDRVMPTATPTELGPPHGAFVVVYAAGRPVAGGGVKRLDEHVAEIKRMYVVPHARGQGHARRLLAALEDAARDLGYERVRLDTGPRQPHARALYASAGYAEIPDYNANPLADYWAEKSLTAAAPRRARGRG
jgi:GNAT superfamily N-acetyltransferase